MISTISSGSGSYREDNLTPPPSTQNPDTDLDLSPGGGAKEGESDQREQGLNLINNNNKSTATRVSSCRQQVSPYTRRSMAPNPQLTYLDRVVMEIIETERMYVRDLRMIVEVSPDPRGES